MTNKRSMAAYAALVSLENALEVIRNHPTHSFSFDNIQITSLSQTVHFLIDLMETYDSHSPGYIREAAEALERRIASAAHTAKDVIKSHLVDQIQAGTTRDGKARPNFLLDLQKAIENVDFVKTKAMRFQAKSGLKAEHPTYSPPASSEPPIPKKNVMVGYDNVVRLQEMLVRKPSSRLVIPIVGMGGIGKTTLARNVFEHLLIQRHFDVHLWATISQQNSVETTLTELLFGERKSATGGNGNVGELGKQLHKKLFGRRYLIVLDDMWSVGAWHEIHMYLPHNSNGSRVIVTTRLSKLAAHLSSSPFVMSCLDDDESWELFCGKAFGEEEYFPVELKKIGKKIVERCRGVPLSIVVIGGHLRRSSRAIRYWEKVANFIYSISSLALENQCLEILSLSYGHLPAYLKPCFLYMGIFEEDEQIDASRLVKLWVAEGFVRQNKSLRLEEVAEDYLKDLIDRNLILVRQRRGNGKAEVCGIHDLVRELCLKVSEEEKFMLVLEDATKDRYSRSFACAASSTDASAKGFPAIELQKENVDASPVENLESEPTSTTESKLGTRILIEESSDMLDVVISKISTADSNSSSISEYEIEQQFADEIAEEGILPEDSEKKMSVSDFDSQQRVESECYCQIQAVDETMTAADAEKSSVELQETRVSSNAAERSKHHEEIITVTEPVYFQENGHYLVAEENKHLQLNLNNQIISICDYSSLSPPNSSPASAMLNLVEQDLHELSENPNYSNSLILFLQRNKRLTLIHPSFFDTMPGLRFLDISDTKIRILPSSLFKLSKLKVLLLRNCMCLEMLPPEIGKLVHLEVLDLSGTELYDLPDEIGQLKLARSMQLSFYGPDDESEYGHLPSQLVSPSFLSELKGLESLSISVHPEDHRWVETVKCLLKDMSKLEMLSNLQFYFPEVETFEEFIQTSPSWENQRLSKFSFTLGQNVKRIGSRVSDEVESLFSQQERCLRYVNGNNKASPLLKSVLIRTTSFYLDHHTEVQSLSEFDICNFNELRFCVMRECPKMQTILDEKTAGMVAFPRLEYLGIFFLWELKHIWKVAPQVGRLKSIFKTPAPFRSFEGLKCLIIKTCPKLEFVLWESMLRSLAKLEELVVEDCEGVEKIIKEENKKAKYKDNLLPGLRKLVLHYLPKLVSLGNGVHLSEKEIIVHGCPKLILSS